MIIYEVSYIDDKQLPLKDIDLEIKSVYFSNAVKAKSFIAKSRKLNREESKQYAFTLRRFEIKNSKQDILNFLNKETQFA